MVSLGAPWNSIHGWIAIRTTDGLHLTETTAETHARGNSRMPCGIQATTGLQERAEKENRKKRFSEMTGPHTGRNTAAAAAAARD